MISKSEITRSIREGRKLSEEEGTAVLDQFEEEQPEIYQAIFGPLSDAIGEDSLDMSYLFLDLCFDIIWVYRKEFGNPPKSVAGKEWLNAKIGRLDAEMKALDVHGLKRHGRRSGYFYHTDLYGAFPCL